MKFGGKYEILKSLVRGDVEAFAVCDRKSGERLLAYIFPCSEPPQDQPTAQWILRTLARLAGEAPGNAIDLGKYEVANFAYVVTSWPAPEVLDAWIRQNQSEADSAPQPDSSEPASDAAKNEQQATSKQIVADEAVRARPSGTFSALQPPDSLSKPSMGQDNVRGEVTLEGFGSQPREPGEFTRQFFREVGVQREEVRLDLDVTSPAEDTFTNQFERQSASGTNSFEVPPSGASTSPDLNDRQGHSDLPSGFPTKLFVQSLSAEPSPEQVFGESEPARLSSGEFTKFFQTPSAKEEGGAQSKSPIRLRTETGEFPRMFGSEVPRAADEPNLQPPVFDHPSTSLRGSSTEILNRDSALRNDRPDNRYAFETKENSQTIDESTSTQIFAEHKGLSVTTPTLTSPGLSASDAIPSPNHLEAAATGGATVLLQPAPEVAAEFEAGSSAGPSEYTRFMSREEFSSSVLESGDAVPPPSKSTAGGVAAAGAFVSPFVTPPAVPSYQAPTPQVPAYPTAAAPGGAAPGMPAGAPPTVAAPGLPIPAAQPSLGPKSYWPLIITLNVLFLLAVLLIVYFALRHH